MLCFGALSLITLSNTPTPSQRHHWRKTKSLTATLLTVLLAVTFGVSYFARELSFSFFGWPFSFWVASQGALGVYVLIIGVYAHVMARWDLAHAVDEE